MTENKTADFSEFSIEDILTNLTSLVMILDLQKNIIYTNKALLDFLECEPAEELIGKSIDELTPDEETERLGGVLKRVVEGKTFKDFDTQFITRGKKKIPVNFTAFPLKNTRGDITGIFGAANDLRQLKGLLESLRLAKSELEARIEERTKELQKRVNELELFQRAAINRELKMVELKKQIEELKKG